MDFLRRARCRLASLWRNLGHRRAIDDDLDDEVRATFDLFVDEQVRTGIDPAEARRRATIALGRPGSIATQVREARSGAGLETFWLDVRFGARMLRRSPLFTLTAVLSLGAGIGANTTIFSVVNVLLLRDVDVAGPRQLVEIGRTTRGGWGTAFSYPAYELLRDQNGVFSGVLALSKETVEGKPGAAARPPAGRFVSGNFFELLHVAPLAGRLLVPADDRPDAPAGSALAVIAYRFWQREFGGSVAAIGQTVRVDSTSFTIVGVLPSTFDDLVVGRPADFFIPMASEALIRRDSVLRSPSSSWIGVVGRLKPGVTIEVARANLEPLWSRFLVDITSDIPDAEARQRILAQRVFVQSASRGVSDVRRDFSKPVLLLMAAVSLILFIACGNVINLLLARGVARRRDSANRLSDGFFATMAIPLLLGRDFTPDDGAPGSAGVIVNDALARRYFTNENPMGRRIVLGDRRPREIVGVVANAKYYTLRDPEMPTAFLYTLTSGEPRGLTLAVRTAGDPLASAAAIRRQVESVAGNVPVSNVRAMASQVERTLATERLLARLLSAFAGLAILLASIGLYGVLGYYVVHRTGEIGLRLALGATRGAVLRSVLRQSVIVVAAGSVVGIPIAVFSSRSLSSLLYGVTPSDAGVLAGSVASLFVVAMIAAAIPACRASRVDPLVALRHE